MIDDDDNPMDDDNLDEFESSDFEEEESFDNFDDGKEATLADIIREKPAVKIAIIVGVLFLLYLLFSFFKSDEVPAPSVVPNASEVSVAPGTQEVPDNIRAAIEESDEQRRELAEKTGQSALPTLIEPPSQQLELEQNGLGEEDPLQRWRALQQERLKQEQEDTRFVDQEDEDTAFSAEDLQAMADAMAAQMQAILETQSVANYATLAITPAEYLEVIKAKQAEEALALAGLSADSDEIQIDPLTGEIIETNNDSDIEVVEILVPAGDIEYAQLILEANSDTPGPVLARIAGGPLNGSKILGSFATQEEYLTLRFNTLIKDGISQPISAIAIDPATSLTGIATEVDHRYFTRIILPTAAAFIQGAAEAIAASGQTTITIDGAATSSTTTDTNTDTDEEIASGIEQAAEEFGEIMEERSDNIETLIRVHAGTPIGLLFLEPVLKE